MPCRFSSAASERGHEPGSHRLHGGEQAEERGREECDHGAEGEHAAVDANLLHLTHGIGHERAEHAAAGDSDRESPGAAEDGEQRVLGEELPHDASTTRAERGPYR